MTRLHTCTQTDSGIDCTACKLAQLCEERKDSHATMESDSKKDYSISEELTDKDGNASIFFLVIAAAATLACVVFFSWIFS